MKTNSLIKAETKLQKKEQFIILRAEGQSLRACAKELKVSKDTCAQWDRELEDAIAELRADNLQAVYTQYGLYRESRIKALGDTVNSIDNELASRDFSDIPTDKLLDYKLKYTTALANEYIPIQEDRTRAKLGHLINAKEILNRLDDLHVRVQGGETTKEQAQIELSVLAGMLRTYETSGLEDKIEKLRRAITR